MQAMRKIFSSSLTHGVNMNWRDLTMAVLDILIELPLLCPTIVQELLELDFVDPSFKQGYHVWYI